MTAETISFPLDPGAAALLTRLHAAGHAAYAVGGCVRDSLLGQTPHDWDLCTSATPEQVLELFGEAHCIPTGLQHGTVTVKHGGELYEITTFRTEGAYSDGRHPDHVAFVPDVKEDLARRDFTINAMAYNAEEGLIDPFGGQNDLAAGIVRAVGEPQRRFEEDALRILRLYRFAARFRFAIDPATGQAARALCRHLDCVSEERIAEELSRLLAAPAPGAYLEAEVLAVIFPELDAAELPESRRILDALEPGMEHVPVRLAALLCPLGEAGARAALRRLKCSNALTGTVATLVREAAAEMPGAALTLTARRFLSRYDLATITDLTALCSARHPEQAEAFAALQQEAARLVETNACCRINQLAVNGRDLMDAGVRPGPGLRRVLDTLLEQVLTGQLPNEKAALLAAAAQVAAS
ncbi:MULTISPECIES: CCA tRNA nucleotidyltransferase [Faecalibacterium]|jgi:tRNA nucleotidyltransferase (CCA-adding enzyme)|uniref:CCA tRNA nucleotidyltransferase n=1 Tax=Faecalibacterium TaxID=216851 RepID=UPI001FAB09E8|nr:MULTISPECIES: CCA tRNA nucleotidyltransferase [Faecalibacterium]